MIDARKLAFENTIIHLEVARPLQRMSAGMLIPANTRAIMAAGLAGEVRMRAGHEVEDELSRLRPLHLGHAYPTGPGRLKDEGIELIAHAVVTVEPGEKHRTGRDEIAFAAGLDLFDETGISFVTLPVFQQTSAQTMGRVLIGHLRRRSRIRNVIVAGLDGQYLMELRAEMIRSGAFPVE